MKNREKIKRGSWIPKSLMVGGRWRKPVSGKCSDGELKSQANVAEHPRLIKEQPTLAWLDFRISVNQ